MASCVIKNLHLSYKFSVVLRLTSNIDRYFAVILTILKVKYQDLPNLTPCPVGNGAYREALCKSGPIRF